ncbi:UNVERIFIED_CONTAM: chlorophyllase-like protein [Acetivibrio alkalicellulosi]
MKNYFMKVLVLVVTVIMLLSVVPVSAESEFCESGLLFDYTIDLSQLDDEFIEDEDDEFSALQANFSQTGPYRTTSMRSGSHTIFYPQNLGANGVKHPIIAWGNGTGATPSSYTGILNHLASYGFVVVAANTTQAGSGREMIQGIDLMISENRNSRSTFYNKLDTAAIGVSGHSQGGIGAVAASMSDSRIVCSLPIMGTKTRSGSVRTPTFALAGANDRIVTPRMVRSIYTSCTGTAIYAELRGAGHMVPSGRSPSRDILNYTVAWFRLYLMNDTSQYDTFFNSRSGIQADSRWTNVQVKNAPRVPTDPIVTPTPTDPIVTPAPTDPSPERNNWWTRYRFIRLRR